MVRRTNRRPLRTCVGWKRGCGPSAKSARSRFTRALATVLPCVPTPVIPSTWRSRVSRRPSPSWRHTCPSPRWSELEADQERRRKRMATNRRQQIRLSPGEQAEFFRERRKGALATIDKDGFPHVVAMNYFSRDGAFYMTSYGKAQKVVNIRRNP